MIYTTLLMRTNTGSEYLEWVKTKQPARFNLAASGVVSCTLSDLVAGGDDIQINGPRLGASESMLRAIAEHCRVPVDSVVAGSGTSMANFIAMAALIEPG